jgi:hypothetical protein
MRRGGQLEQMANEESQPAPCGLSTFPVRRNRWYKEQSQGRTIARAGNAHITTVQQGQLEA